MSYDPAVRCQGCGSLKFRFIPAWGLLMCNLCCVALDWVTAPEREWILSRIYAEERLPYDWCCWIYRPEVGTCRLHGNVQMNLDAGLTKQGEAA